MPLSYSSILVVTTLLGGATAINNGLAITPPMGWVRYSTIIFDLALMKKE
jgi:alpha-galactosidase